MRGAGSIVLAGVAAGLAAAAVNLVEDSHYRAETTLVLQRGSEPIDSRGTARTFAQLVRTDAVASNVVRNLRLDESASDLLDRVSVAVVGNALLRVRVEDEERTRARQIAQELALVRPGVGGGPRRARRGRRRAVPTAAAPRPGGPATGGADVPRLLLALAGAACASVAATQISTEATVALALVLAVVAAAKLAGGAVRAVQVAVPATAAAVVGVVALPPSVLVAVTLAAGAVCGLLALARRPASAAAPVLEPSPPAEEPAPAAPEPAPPRPRKLRVSEHEWDVEALAELVESRANAHPEQAEEWRAFVDELRGHAVDGVLPANSTPSSATSTPRSCRATRRVR